MLSGWIRRDQLQVVEMILQGIRPGLRQMDQIKQQQSRDQIELGRFHQILKLIRQTNIKKKQWEKGKDLEEKHQNIKNQKKKRKDRPDKAQRNENTESKNEEQKIQNLRKTTGGGKGNTINKKRRTKLNQYYVYIYTYTYIYIHIHTYIYIYTYIWK